MGKGVWRWEKEIIYLSLHCRHQNDPCIKMGSDESHCNVSLLVKDKAARRCPQTTTFWGWGEKGAQILKGLCGEKGAQVLKGGLT